MKAVHINFKQSKLSKWFFGKKPLSKHSHMEILVELPCGRRTYATGKEYESLKGKNEKIRAR